MSTKKHNGILQKLEARSSNSYEKVASRMRLAIKIADAIEQSGMSKKEFATKLGKQPSEISKWLSGTHNFTIDTLNDISSVLNIRLVDDQTQSFTSNYRIVVDTYDVISSIKSPIIKSDFETISNNGTFGYNSIIHNPINSIPCCGIA